MRRDGLRNRDPSLFAACVEQGDRDRAVCGTGIHDNEFRLIGRIVADNGNDLRRKRNGGFRALQRCNEITRKIVTGQP